MILNPIFAKKCIELRIFISRKDITFEGLVVLENESLYSVQL